MAAIPAVSRLTVNQNLVVIARLDGYRIRQRSATAHFRHMLAVAARRVFS